MDGSNDGSRLRVEAPAKLNLFLEILAKRADGFHEIETVMTAISLEDTLYAASNSDGKIRLDCKWASGTEARQSRVGAEAIGDLPQEADNIVYKAAERLRERANVDAGATIQLIKRIPSQAGLGGASTDAAAAIWALNQVWNLNWPATRLAEFSSEIGSDVPFFLGGSRRGAHAAVCRGRGEKIQPVPRVRKLHLIIAKPRAGLSTARVYANCQVPTEPRKCESLTDALTRGDAHRVGRQLFNRLQETAEPMCPELNRLRRWFEQSDVLGHQMSGSGTSYFGIGRSARHARQLTARLRNANLGEVYYATTRSAM